MYRVFSLKDFQNWDDAINRLSAASKDVYFTPEYYSLYQNYGDGEANCFVFEKDGYIALYPFLLNPITPLGYKLDKEYYDIQGAYGYNGIITSSNDKNFISSFWEAFDSYCSDHSIVAEFTRFHPLLNNQQLASPKMQIIFSRHTISLDLTLLEDEIWKSQISSKNRNMIRKAEKEGVVIVDSNDYNSFKLLYDGTMIDLNAEDFYFFSQAYYDEYQVSFKDKSFLYLAIYADKPIAGSMFMFSNDYAHYHLSARDREYSRYAANNLIIWYAIRKAKAHGCKWLHLGGGTTSDEGDSLLQFKKSFSKKESEFWIGKRIHNEDIYNEIVCQWKTRFPDHYANNKVKLLGYREIPK